MPETQIDVLADICGIKPKTEDEDNSKKSSGMVQVVLYRKNGTHSTKDISHLVGTVEEVEEAFPELFSQIRGSIGSEQESIAMVIKALAVIENTTKDLPGDSMLEYALKKINKAKASQ